MDDDELALRTQEIRYQFVHLVIASLLLLVGFATAAAAIRASLEAGKAVNAAQDAVAVAQDSALRASRQQRFSDGMQALGGDSAPQRIAGLAVLRRSAIEGVERVTATQDQKLLAAVTEQDRAEARATYLATLKALENYVGAWHLDVDGVSPSGDYFVPKDVQYALNDLSRLLDGDRAPMLDALNATMTIDMAQARLLRANLRGFEVGWIGKGNAFFVGIDLRRASLANSSWDGATMCGARLADAHLGSEEPTKAATLAGTDLREADLTGADLRNVDLRQADLRKADLTDADLEGAQLAGAKLAGARVPPNALEVVPDIDQAEGLGVAADSDAEC